MARLNYRHLHYFWRVATTGNLTQAARDLHVSQSALSSQIRQLEQSMDTALFLREGRSLTLTEAGHQALAYAEVIFSKGEELEALLRTGHSEHMKTLRIGTLATMSRNFIQSFIHPLSDRTDVRYSLHSLRQTGLLNDLYTHQLDVGLTSVEVMGSTQDVLQCQLLARQPVSVIGPPGLALGSKGISKRYHRHNWILPTRDIPFRSAFDSICTQHHFSPTISAEADDMAMLRLLARDSGALTVLPEVVVRDELAAGRLVVYLRLTNVYENFYAITIKRQFHHTLVGELIKAQLLREYGSDDETAAAR